MGIINTTHGLLDESVLAKTVGFEDRPNEFVVWVEWRRVATGGEVGNRPISSDERNAIIVWRAEGSQPQLVRRDAHVILKEPSVVADAIANNLG